MISGMRDAHDSRDFELLVSVDASDLHDRPGFVPKNRIPVMELKLSYEKKYSHMPTLWYVN